MKIKKGSIVYRADSCEQYGEVSWIGSSDALVYWADGRKLTCPIAALIVETSAERIRAVRRAAAFRAD